MGKKVNIIKEEHQKSIPKYIGIIQKMSKGATKNKEGQ